MKTNQYSEPVFGEDDLCNLVLRGTNLGDLKQVIVDGSVDVAACVELLEQPANVLTWTTETDSTQTVQDWDRERQQNWFMPDEYKNLDIAQYILSLCKTDAELQRCGQELLMFQERDMFDLLRYLKYLVDTLTSNNVIWGVGRGSSVASYVLYKLQVHRIDSLYYELDPTEFLR